ncbi:MAG: hypothetical protein OXD37_03385 [Acidimicrobiaceae bacterium]|nr:hypothetical protein [Acidimicrobiaceae bacterium]
MTGRIRWGLVALLAVASLALLGAGVAGGRWTIESWSNAALAVASGLLVLLFGVVVEPHLVRKVKAATREAVRAETEPLEQRVVSLEALAASQPEQRQAVEDEVAAAVDLLRSHVTRDAAADVLRRGVDLDLFEAMLFRLRASVRIEGPDLFLLLMEYGKVSELWMNFGPVMFGSLDPSQWDPLYGPDEENPVGIVWEQSQPATAMVRALHTRLLSDGIECPAEFDLARALDTLAKSLEVAFAARSGELAEGRTQGAIDLLSQRRMGHNGSRS